LALEYDDCYLETLCSACHNKVHAENPASFFYTNKKLEKYSLIVKVTKVRKPKIEKDYRVLTKSVVLKKLESIKVGIHATLDKRIKIKDFQVVDDKILREEMENMCEIDRLINLYNKIKHEWSVFNNTDL
jgi:hypothetical protein